MTFEIPKQLQNPAFRFYRVQNNGKLPCDKGWNKPDSSTQINFFDERLKWHISTGGNYGVCCGIGQLIVLDFDQREFYESMACKLPPTFTVLSARKKLPHLYYILDGEMFKKHPIRDENENTLVDIQAAGAGIVAPGSAIDRSVYVVVNDIPISTITQEKLLQLFDFEMKNKSDKVYDETPNEEKIQLTVDYLLNLKIRRTGPRMFQCPFHEMKGNGNLSIMPNGEIYCFHESKFWPNVAEFQHTYVHRRYYG